MLKRIAKLFSLMMLMEILAQPSLADPTSFARTFTHHNASVNGVHLHYVRGGRGDVIVLLPGWPQTWYAWRKVMPALAVMALGGEKSTGSTMLSTMQLVASNVQGGVVPDCGHYIAEERPDYLAKRILPFFDEEKELLNRLLQRLSHPFFRS